MSAPPQYTVVVSQRNFDTASFEYLAEHGCAVLLVPLPEGKGDGDLSENELVTELLGADAWIVGHARVTGSLLRRLPRLKAICRRGVGYERVDTAAVAALRKVATIAVGGNDAAVADHALGLMLAVAHRLCEGQARLLQGDWSIPVGSDLYRKTVGIVGLGRIGRGVARRLAGFDCEVLAAGPGPAQEGVQRVELAELLRRSDFVSLHAPLNEATRFLIDRRTLALMKPGAILVNTARGGLVHDGDLLQALTEGRLGGAGLDVFASEADPAFSPTTEALLRLPNVVASPHSGGSTHESLQRTNLIAAHCAVAVLEGRSPDPACMIADGRPPSA